MPEYQCPICGEKMQRDLIRFLDHGNQHVIDSIKKQHPNWVESDGVCKKCAEMLQKTMSGEIRKDG